MRHGGGAEPAIDGNKGMVIELGFGRSEEWSGAESYGRYVASPRFPTRAASFHAVPA